MNNSKKKSVRFAAVITMLLLCITYFSVLSPTTAYFYKTNTNDLDVTFSLFDVSQNVLTADPDLRFKAATKFEDFDEYLFDSVAIVKNATVTNTGNVKARVYTRINPTAQSLANGLNYIVFMEKVTEGGASDAVLPTKAFVKGPLKQKIETTLNTYSSSFVAGISETSAETILNNYNSANSNKSITIDSGESVNVQIIFWAEYGKAENTLKQTSPIQDISYNANVKIIATQNTDSAMPTA